MTKLREDMVRFFDFVQEAGEGHYADEEKEAKSK